VWPELIAPDQPFTGVRSLSYSTAGGADLLFALQVRMVLVLVLPLPPPPSLPLLLTVRTLQAEDAFEVEDQRQWGDASFKTYVRPLSKPWRSD